MAAEPAACPTLTRGAYRYDFGDTAGLTPLMPMYTLGHDFVPPPVHAGGLRYHGDSPMVCGPGQGGRGRGAGLPPERDLRGRRALRAHEGIIPAPEPAHAIRAAIDEAEAAREAGEARVILFGLCGHGHFDLSRLRRLPGRRRWRIRSSPSRIWRPRWPAARRRRPSPEHGGARVPADRLRSARSLPPQRRAVRGGTTNAQQTPRPFSVPPDGACPSCLSWRVRVMDRRGVGPERRDHRAHLRSDRQPERPVRRDQRQPG